MTPRGSPVLDQPQRTQRAQRKIGIENSGIFGSVGWSNKQTIMEDIKALCNQVRQTAYDIHVYHGQGHLEKVYENALVNRLRKMGLRVEQQLPIKVFDEDGTEIGDYLADLLVEGFLIVELKAAKTLVPEHEAQILGYLKSSRLEHGLLINFGSYRFQIRKFARRDTHPAGGISLSGACGFLFSGISALFSIPRF
jgi:GxxExxY protein